MKLIIAGGRKYRLTPEDLCFLDQLVSELRRKKVKVSEVVTGGQRGADADGEDWARMRGIKTKVFPADWDAHGRSAGPRRNRQIAEYVGSTGTCVIFPGGNGTISMLNEASKSGMTVIVRDSTAKLREQ
jgi:hypothetical protein